MKLPAVIKALNLDVPFKKHTATIHVDGNLTATEHKLLNVLYKSAFDAQEWDAANYYVKLSDIRNLLGVSKINRVRLEESLTNLRRAGISWNIFEQDQKNKDEWDKLSGETGFISSWLIFDRRYIVFSLSDIIKKMIQTPNIFAYLDLRVQQKLTSKYEIVLYELLADELSRSRRDSHVTRWYSIGDLLRIFGITSPQSYLNDFRDFNRHCIKRPIKEISEHSDLTAEINDMEKAGNKIVAYNFKVTKKDTKENIQQEMIFSPDQEELYGYESNYDVIEELAELFNSMDTAKKIYEHVKNRYVFLESKGFNEELIRENIEYAKRSEKGIKNFLGYVRMAIDNDYAQYETKFKKAAQEQLETEEKKRRAEFKAEQAKQQKYIEEKAYEKLEKEKQNELIWRLKSVNIVEVEAWTNCLSYLQNKVESSSFSETWLETLKLFVDETKNAYFILPNEFFCDYIKEHYIDLINESLVVNNVEIASLNFITSIEHFFNK